MHDPFTARRAQLLSNPRLIGSAFCRAYSDLADRWLTELLAGAENVALVAVGGYGRRQLCPGSDLDVLLLHGGRKDIASVADRVWYAVWDAGVPLDHSVRTVREALSTADANLEAALGLLDARLVAGDAELFAQLATAVADQWSKRRRRRMEDLALVVDERHRRAGEVAFLLEPNLKEGKGGLRDVQALRAAGVAAPIEAEEVLLQARVELHRATGRATERLVLEEQDPVADALGAADADALMAGVAGAARTIAWLSDDTWARVRSSLLGPNDRRIGSDRVVAPGIAIRDGEVALAADADPAGDPSLSLRAAVVAAESGAPIHRRALERLASEQCSPPDPWPASVRAALIALLGTGHVGITQFEALDQHGLIVRLLPEWERVRNRPQRNAYHRFTVDRHLCETAANAAALVRAVPRPDLLLIGAWLHDIGKGVPGRDHTDAGIELMQVLASRMGFEPADVGVLVQLVRHHLLLPDAATRRDLDDPATIRTVAEAVGDTTTLELLAALTEADSIATGPSAWGEWKARLVSALVERAAAVLDPSRPPPPSTPAPDVVPGVVTVTPSEGKVTIAAPDRPGVLWRLAAVLALHGLDIHGASASDRDGMAIDVFEVDAGPGGWPDWSRVQADAIAALEDRLPLADRMAARAQDYAARYRPRTADAPQPRVIVDEGASDDATVIEVRAPDSVGLLYRLAKTLDECGLDVRSARVSTMGHEVVDAFYVRGVDILQMEALEAAVLRAVAG